MASNIRKAIRINVNDKTLKVSDSISDEKMSRLLSNQLRPGLGLIIELMLNVSVSAIGSRISSRSRPKSSPTSLLPKFQHNVR